MDCQETRSLFVRYLDEDLGLEDRLTIEEHVAHCYPCCEELNDLRTLLAACDHALTPPPPTRRFEDLMPLLHSAPPPQVPAYSVWRDVFRFVAAAAVVLLMIGTVDTTVGSMRRVLRATDRAMREQPVPDESAQGLLGWRQRIAWAETVGQNTAQKAPAAQDKAAPETPRKPEDTTWILRPNRSGRIEFASICDRRAPNPSFQG